MPNKGIMRFNITVLVKLVDWELVDRDEEHSDSDADFSELEQHPGLCKQSGKHVENPEEKTNCSSRFESWAVGQ